MISLTYPFDGKELFENKRSIRRELLNDGSKRITKKVAVLGGSITIIICS